jgi:signal transduction histidine kinase
VNGQSSVKPAGWTLRNRLRLWFGLTSTGLVLLIALASNLQIKRSIERELHSLVSEELDEFLVLGRQGLEHEVLAQVVAELESHHPGFPMQFDVWSADGQRLLGSYGSKLVESDPALVAVKLYQTQELGRSLRLRAGRFESGERASVVLDGSLASGKARAFDLSVLAIVLVALGVSLGVAELFSRGIGRMLRDVAAGVGDLRLGDPHVNMELADPPEEIRAVVTALGEMAQRVREEFERSQVLTAAMAHELRAPIQNMLGEVDVTLLRERQPGEYAEVLGHQRELLFELSDAIDNLLTLCRSATGRAGAPAEAFDLGREVELRIERLKRTARFEDVELGLQARGNLALVGDREGLWRALRNLIANGIQWTSSGSRVEVVLDGSGERVRAEVLDRGPGIAPAERELLFEPFQRGGQRNGQRAGYGLGLTIVRNAVEAQGGSLRLEDREGGGTRAIVELPRGAVVPEPEPQPVF